MLDVAYALKVDDRQPFSWRCSSIKSGADMLREDAFLIKEGIAECIQHFLMVARDAKVL